MPMKMYRTTDPSVPDITKIFPTLPSILKKYERYGRKDFFKGKTKEEFKSWQDASRDTLRELLGLDKMEFCPLVPQIDESILLECAENEGDTLPVARITRHHIIMQTEPDVFLTAYLLIPETANADTPAVLCPPGHNGAGKYTVAGIRTYAALRESIEKYNYDYGLQLARLGYVVLCPDIRGFGERRECLEDTEQLPQAMKGDCYWLAHMGEPLGIPVLGMLVWDLMRCVDFFQSYTVTRERELVQSLHLSENAVRWDADRIITFGFSGGAMQSLYLAALEPRIHAAFLSGYLYGFRDSLLEMNRNCSCNYVPHLMEHFDMGDIASLAATRRLMIQSCREDRLNGKRGITNVQEQVDIIRNNYETAGEAAYVRQDIAEGPHHLDTTYLRETMEWLRK